jgi:hypothetical protein
LQQELSDDIHRAGVLKANESRTRFGNLGELNSVSTVVEAGYDNASGTTLDVIDPEVNVQLRSYFQREHHLYVTAAEGEISGFLFEAPLLFPLSVILSLLRPFFRGCCLRSCRWGSQELSGRYGPYRTAK